MKCGAFRYWQFMDTKWKKIGKPQLKGGIWTKYLELEKVLSCIRKFFYLHFSNGQRSDSGQEIQLQCGEGSSQQMVMNQWEYIYYLLYSNNLTLVVSLLFIGEVNSPIHEQFYENALVVRVWGMLKCTPTDGWHIREAVLFLLTYIYL